VMVVYGMEGLDEISISGDTLVGELKNNEVREYTVHPRQFGMTPSDIAAIQVHDAAQAKDMLLSVLSGLPGPARDILALNAGAAIYTAGLAESHESGVKKALAVITSGAAKAKLDQFIGFTQKLKS
jgi:anthranilate phosphoribosyltransferase